MVSALKGKERRGTEREDKKENKQQQSQKRKKGFANKIFTAILAETGLAQR